VAATYHKYLLRHAIITIVGVLIICVMYSI